MSAPRHGKLEGIVVVVRPLTESGNRIGQSCIVGMPVEDRLDFGEENLGRRLIQTHGRLFDSLAERRPQIPDQVGGHQVGARLAPDAADQIELTEHDFAAAVPLAAVPLAAVNIRIWGKSAASSSAFASRAPPSGNSMLLCPLQTHTSPTSTLEKVMEQTPPVASRPETARTCGTWPG